ncbi:hypothetical protein AA958_19190 [Streptomyces sp. CNQ-509]|uniref:CU044_2847 family protein n=1 Tax=Streptomyces sp. CNQ-509 TaxID=444103 RepID=UPI00062DDB41|nr:CU044_2847 family protein [Streptomyces sp. CNQ-509]AKH83959.1 hypothetical protein AA958_19190 [Streptomyces sp. CNQ-509]
MVSNERRSFHVVEVPLNDGEGVVRVQVEEADESVVRVGRGSRTAARAEESLDRMLEVVRPVANAFVGRCQDMGRQPDEATLQFGMSLTADAKILIAGSSAAANFSVSLTWRHDNAEPRPPDSGERRG